MSSNVGLSEGESVSAVEKVLPGGLGEISEADQLALGSSSSDFTDLISGLVGVRCAPPARKSSGCSDPESSLDALGDKSPIGPIRREAEDPASPSMRNSTFGGDLIKPWRTDFGGDLINTGRVVEDALGSVSDSSFLALDLDGISPGEFPTSQVEDEAGRLRQSPS